MTALTMVLWIVGTLSISAAGMSQMTRAMDWFWDRGHEELALVSAYAVGLGPAVLWNIALMAVLAP